MYVRVKLVDQTQQRVIFLMKQQVKCGYARKDWCLGLSNAAFKGSPWSRKFVTVNLNQWNSNEFPLRMYTIVYGTHSVDISAMKEN